MSTRTISGRLAIVSLLVCGAQFASLPSASAAPVRPVQSWNDYSPRERYEALRNYRRHEQLPEDRQQKVEKEYERWKAMPEEQRQKIRENYERYQNLSPREQDRLERRYQDSQKPDQ